MKLGSAVGGTDAASPAAETVRLAGSGETSGSAAGAAPGDLHARASRARQTGDAMERNRRAQAQLGALAELTGNLKLATWNIAGGRTVRANGKAFDYGEENRDYFARHLSRVNPDIVCLQESHVSPVTGSLSGKIANDLGLSCVEAVMHTSPIDREQSISLAILSRTPLEATDWQLPDPRFPIYVNGRQVPPLPRRLLVARLDAAGIFVATTHANPDAFLGFDYEHGVGTTHAADLAHFFEERLPSGPLLFAGDFNTDNALPVFFPLTVSSRQLKDALPDTPTVPTWGTRPDHVLYTPGFEVVSSGVEATTEADHYLAWASFEAPARGARNGGYPGTPEIQKK